MVKQIIKEAIEKNPIGLKEAVEAELMSRLQLSLSAKTGIQMMESKSPKSLRDFQIILSKIDSELTRKMRKKYGKTGGDDTEMFNIRPKDLNNGYFSYEFDGYLTTIVQFNDDNSVSAWYDVRDLKSIKDKSPNQVFKTVGDMIDKMSTEIANV